MPNPYNTQRYYKVDMRPEAVDCIVFWTKNPLPFIKFLPDIENLGYLYYFQFTITPYNRSVERNLPNKIKLIQTFKELSSTLGSHRMVWRYDPILINDIFTLEYHTQAFASMAKMLSGYTQKCIISFVDCYKNMQRRLGNISQYSMSIESMYAVAEILSDIAQKYHIELYTCAEEMDFSAYGIQHASCIDKKTIESIVGYDLDVAEDKHQRPACKCVESIEIGTYNCCANGCNYCYALSSEESSRKNMASHDPKSSVLIGELPQDALITERPNHSLRITRQLSLLEQG